MADGGATKVEWSRDGRTKGKFERKKKGEFFSSKKREGKLIFFFPDFLAFYRLSKR